MDHRAAVVFAGNVARRINRGDAGRRGYGRKVHRAQARVRHAAGAECAVQCIGRQRDVVGVAGLAAHVQVRALVGRCGAGDAHGTMLAVSSSTRIGAASRPGPCAL